MKLTRSEVETIRIHMNAFKEELCNQGRWVEAQEYQDIVDKLDGLLTAESVIRCKDCKWCVEHYDTDGNAPYWVCKNWDGGTDADGYCHEAERKES